MVIYAKNARLSFDGLGLGEAINVELPPAGPDTCDFSDGLKMKPGKHTGTFTLDAESAKNVRNLMMYPYQKEAMERISKLAGRTAKFEFCPPVFYHGDMLRNTDDRRITFMRPSNVGKTTAMVIQPRGTYGKLSAYASRLYERTAEMQETADWINNLKDLLRAEPDEVRDSNGKWHRAGPQQPMPTFESICNMILRIKVRDICANWGRHGR